MTLLSVVVPCYNEEKNIPFIFERFAAACLGRDNIEVVLVDNGSKDNSQAVFTDCLAKYAEQNLFKVVKVEVNQGYGFGILSGLNNALGEILSWTHADLQTDPKDVIIALDLYLKVGDPNLLVKGSRKNRRILEAFFSFGMQVLSSIVLGEWLTEVNAQPKLFSKAFYEKHIKNGAPNDFSLDLYLLYKAKKCGKVLEFPVFFAKRLYGEAKGGGSWKTRIKLIKRTYGYIFELRSQLNQDK